MKTKNPRMMLLRKEDRKDLPPLYSQEKVKDPMVWVKFFTPWTSFTFYATEFDQQDSFFGWVCGHECELGYFSLSELQSIKGPFGLHIERDMHFRPQPLSEVKRRHQEYGAANPRRSEGPFEAVQRKLARQTLNMPPEIAGVMGPPSVADSYYILKKCPKCGKRTVRNQILGANICYKCKRMFYPGDTVGIPVPTGNPSGQLYVKGKIIEYSWGYDQTNIDFYKILDRKGGFVTLVGMGSREVGHEGSMVGPTGVDKQSMTGRVVPTDVLPKAKPFRRKVHINKEGEEFGVAIHSYGWASLWDGKPAHYSSYANPKRTGKFVYYCPVCKKGVDVRSHRFASHQGKIYHVACLKKLATNPKKRFALLASEREKECTHHVFRYTGKIPNTGPQVCYLCGVRKEDAMNPREPRTIMDWSKKLYAMKGDKFIVRVVGWKTTRTRAIFGVTLPRESITSINEIPKSAEWVMVAFFKPDGTAAGKSARVSLDTMRKHMILTA